MNKDNPLQRFLAAQEKDYEIALSEIRQGKKRSHWIWYIFPQIQGLGMSATSKFYAISDLAEANAYLSHPVLGSRLIELCKILLQLKSNDALNIFGSPDDVKLKSSMTLFSVLATDPVFQQVLDKFFQGKADQRTLEIIDRLQ